MPVTMQEAPHSHEGRRDTTEGRQFVVGRCDESDAVKVPLLGLDSMEQFNLAELPPSGRSCAQPAAGWCFSSPSFLSLSARLLASLVFSFQKYESSFQQKQQLVEHVILISNANEGLRATEQKRRASELAANHV